jgi:hypothetical protein
MRVTTIAALVVCAVTTSSATATDKASAKPATKAVTVTGCLERDNNVFRLTDTSGAQVPKARSWKTGFLTKRSADLDVVDPSKRIKLHDHVGHRDALTGMMRDGALRVQSVRHLAASCGQ